MASPTKQSLQSPSHRPSHTTKPDLIPNNSPQIPAKFQLFSKLPIEIRQRIYIFSLPGPRLIPLIYTPPVSTPQPQTVIRYLPPLSPPPPPDIKHSKITTPTPLQPPSLLHVNREARALIHTIYHACLSLSGLSHTQNRSEMLYNTAIDILYFPSLPGYNASWNNFTAIHTLTRPSSLRRTKRLAVSEDAFLEEEKKRWSRRQVDSGTGIGIVGKVDGSDSECRTDGVTIKNLKVFWDVVKRKFKGVEEVWILGAGAENGVLMADFDGFDSFQNWPNTRFGESAAKNMGRMSRNRRLSFEGKVEKAVEVLEDETGWTAPRWRISCCKDEEEEMISLNMEKEMRSGQRDGGKNCLHDQQTSPDFKVIFGDDRRLACKDFRCINE
ncbi:hypothetical protein VTL71DRAFT_8682 [Oculimacula yallundae]|uniref:2EXR domain-containing protein n=1 Tax=Oculimacula yallundae TaxID=86028 RepID=A0ABR4CYF8_9HELO